MQKIERVYRFPCAWRSCVFNDPNAACSARTRIRSAAISADSSLLSCSQLGVVVLVLVLVLVVLVVLVLCHCSITVAFCCNLGVVIIGCFPLLSASHFRAVCALANRRCLLSNGLPTERVEPALHTAQLSPNNQSEGCSFPTFSCQRSSI